MYLLRTCERSNVSVEKKKEKKKQNWKVNIEGEFLFSVRERGEKKKRKEKKKERFARRFEQRVHTVHLQEGVQHLSRTQTTANGLRQPGRFKVGGLSELSLPLATSFIRTIMRFTCFLLHTDDENVHT